MIKSFFKFCAAKRRLLTSSSATSRCNRPPHIQTCLCFCFNDGLEFQTGSWKIWLSWHLQVMSKGNWIVQLKMKTKSFSAFNHRNVKWMFNSRRRLILITVAIIIVYQFWNVSRTLFRVTSLNQFIYFTCLLDWQMNKKHNEHLSLINDLISDAQ